MNPSASKLSVVSDIWRYNAMLLDQTCTVIQSLHENGTTSATYGKCVGPQVRHILEHYEALLVMLDCNSSFVDYDGRKRNQLIQTNVEAAVKKLLELKLALLEASNAALDSPITAQMRTGINGEMIVQVQTTLGRELHFLSSHTIHHLALLTPYCLAAGVDVGPNFGKAPSTIAFERAAVQLGSQ